jgi:hypothetical protein
VTAWKRLSMPIRIGLVMAVLGAGLTVIGVLLGNLAPRTLGSLLLGVLVGGGSWGLIAWAIAEAATD